MSWALKRGGYEVQKYLRGADLIADLPAIRVDLFVLDLHLPEIDGQPLCRLLRSPKLSGFNETPILVVSATSPGVDAKGFTADLGADAFLERPYSVEELLGFARGLLEGVRPRRASHALVVEDDTSMRHAQRLESLGVLAGGIAHDFNNLLAGILANAGIALMDIAVDDPIHDGIVQIEVAASRAAELTEQILTFAGVGRGDRSRFQ